MFSSINLSVPVLIICFWSLFDISASLFPPFLFLSIFFQVLSHCSLPAFPSAITLIQALVTFCWDCSTFQTNLPLASPVLLIHMAHQANFLKHKCSRMLSFVSHEQLLLYIQKHRFFPIFCKRTPGFLPWYSRPLITTFQPVFPYLTFQPN